MLREATSGLPSDAIQFREGFDGAEPAEILRRWERSKHLGVRVTVVVNTLYPEIAGGFYLNLSLFGLIDVVLRQMEILRVVRDVYVPDGLVPVEAIRAFERLEEYVLVSIDQKEVGALSLWQFHSAGGGDHYSDDVVFDFILPRALIEAFREKLRSACSAANVKFTIRTTESAEPHIARTLGFTLRTLFCTLFSKRK